MPYMLPIETETGTRWINMQHIISVYTYGEETAIALSDGNVEFVKETCDEVIDVMQRCANCTNFKYLRRSNNE